MHYIISILYKIIIIIGVPDTKIIPRAWGNFMKYTNNVRVIEKSSFMSAVVFFEKDAAHMRIIFSEASDNIWAPTVEETVYYWLADSVVPAAKKAAEKYEDYKSENLKEGTIAKIVPIDSLPESITVGLIDFEGVRKSTFTTKGGKTLEASSVLIAIPHGKTIEDTFARVRASIEKRWRKPLSEMISMWEQQTSQSIDNGEGIQA